MRPGLEDAGWLAWLDLLLGRYAALLADGGQLMLLADQGREDGSDGGILISGPTVAQQAWHAALPATQGLAIALNLLGLQPPAPLCTSGPGDAADLIAKLLAAPLCDAAALRWLHTQGVTPADLAPPAATRAGGA